MAQLGLDRGLEGKRVVVQVGNVGYNAAQFCQHGGALIIALAEYEGAIYNPKGLDVEVVMKHRKETGSLLNFGRLILDSRGSART